MTIKTLERNSWVDHYGIIHTKRACQKKKIFSRILYSAYFLEFSHQHRSGRYFKALDFSELYPEVAW